ncbi:PepSY-associated TM helix domain-containing protein [Alysiella crassa]|uniref:Uncharacterized iron-regulated membrane protein n=1 Tax=Alysiella crassa TaxID=153491 RepID=A0A376BW23_9NEIS|nr:PepSY domain-containing protein [Alysiella crassa]UOP06606.1 PepSY domain-containing protein [Alysiella crassa]SSY81150.1 Uncharacterized iron-regulated membrane protein [Alysiella crassa]
MNKLTKNQIDHTTENSSSRYFWIWRWHFYAGLFVAPFLMLLAATGLAMILFAHTEGKDGERIFVPIQSIVQPLSQQAQAAINAIDKENATVAQYISPRSADSVAVFRVNDGAGKANMVAIDPYTAQVVHIYPRNQNNYHLMDSIHSDILLGKTGDYLLETAASLTILMILTGVYLWWFSRQRRVSKMLTTGKLGCGRSFWRGWHGVLGTYTSLMLLLFCLSGLAWAGVWGGKVVQAWSQFPAGKWGVAPNPTSTVPVHGDLNDGKTKEIPWVLELTPMPVSGSTLGEKGIAPNLPISLETVDRFVREKGFTGRYQIYLPKGDTGVWTINQDSMSYDSPNPTADRTMHIDRYSGNVLADIRFADYNWFGQFMAVSIAFHMGTMGWWSVALNVVFCLAIIYLCVSAYVLWWKRRPRGMGLCPPAQGRVLPNWKVATIILSVVALIFPTAAVAIMVFALLDWILISRVAVLRKWLK